MCFFRISTIVRISAISEGTARVRSSGSLPLMTGVPAANRSVGDYGLCIGWRLLVRDEKVPVLLVLSTDGCLFEDEGFR